MRTLLVVLLLVALLPSAALAQRRGCRGGGGYSRPVMLAPGQGWGYSARSNYNRVCNTRPVYYSQPLYLNSFYSNPGYFWGGNYATPYYGTSPAYYNANTWRGSTFGVGGSSRYSNPSPVREVEVEEVEPAEGDDKPTLTLPEIK